MSKGLNRNPSHLIDRKIRASQVRVIYDWQDGEGNKHTVNQIMRIHEALEFASSRDLNLVQFGDGKDPIPTCRVLKYSTYRYQEEKKRKLENQNKPVLKEIQVRPSISSNDLQIKSKQLAEFLSKGYTVRMRIKLRGREKANATQHGLFFAELAKKFGDQARIEGKYTPDGVPIGGVLTLKPIKHS